MTSPDVGGLRVARAFGFALPAFTLSLAAHLAAGGRAPSAWASVVLGLVTVWVSLFLTWRRLGVLASVLWLGGLQVLLHQGLMVSSAGECMSPTQGNAREMVGGAMAVCSSQAPALELGWGPGRLAMTCAHLTAAVVLGLVLARGDRAVWFLARLVWPVLPASAPRVGLIPRLVWHGAPTISRARPVALTAVSRRGPPSWTAPACA